MKTFKELKDFCEKNNVRYEINPLYSEPTMIETVDRDENGNLRFKFKEHQTLIGYEFGMNNISNRCGKSEYQWVWYETVVCFDEPTDDTQFFFRARYSQVNGKTYKGWREEMNAEETMERRMA